MGPVEDHRLGRDAQRPAVGHRVARVDGEVHEDLLELPPVGDDGDHVALRADDELQLGAEQPLEHRPHAHDGLGDVDGRRRRGPLPGERQELRRQLRSATGRALDLLDRVHARLALHLARQDAGVAGDDRHEVVEVVCDAAREAPERLEALGLAELLRQSLGLGHVADDQRGRGDLAVLVAHGERRDGVMRLRAVGGGGHHLDVRDRLAARDPLLDRELRTAQPGGQDLDERPPQHVRGPRAERDLRRAVPREDGPVGARREDRVVRRLDDGGQVAPLLLVAPLPGHVAPDRRDPDDLPVRPPDRGEREVDRPLRPVGRQQVRVERRGRAVQDAQELLAPLGRVGRPARIDDVAQEAPDVLVREPEDAARGTVEVGQVVPGVERDDDARGRLEDRLEARAVRLSAPAHSARPRRTCAEPTSPRRTPRRARSVLARRRAPR